MERIEKKQKTEETYQPILFCCKLCGKNEYERYPGHGQSTSPHGMTCLLCYAKYVNMMLKWSGYATLKYSE